MSIKRIIQLQPLIANQIAAGEVVERAASVIKELIENSLDAKATKIEIEIEGGGIYLIRVRDNGHGIVKEDLILAFLRHATSKITSSEDLARIISLGFRGEALASIASVSKCRLNSKARGAALAWQISLQSDLTPEITPSAHSEGTTIEVKDLFYNTPVRRKFLRSEKAENLAIEDVIKRLALSAPSVAFSIKQNKKTKHYPSAHDAVSEQARVGKICGASFIEKAITLAYQTEGLSLRGWIGDPSLCKRQADSQYFFVNNRMVKDKILNHAIKLLYQEHNDYREGTHPCYVLFLDVDPLEVDVNVHPTKQEVRFSQSRRIHDFVTYAVRQAWLNASPITSNVEALPKVKVAQSLPKNYHYENKQPLPKVNIQHQYSKRYAFFEREEGVYIIDLVRSKCRLIELYFEHNYGSVPVKSLLFPLSIKLNSVTFINNEIDLLLKNCGFECKKTPHAIMLLKQPACLEQPLSELVFKEIITHLLKKTTLKELLTLLGTVLPEELLSSINLSSLDIQTLPSIFLSHEDIQKTSVV